MAFTGSGRDLNEFSFDLFETDALGAGSTQDIPGGGTITMLPTMIEKSTELTRVVEIVLSLPESVVLGIVANYFYDKLKAHSTRPIRMTINRREIHLNHSEIVKVIEETIKIEKEAGKDLF